MNHCWSLTAAFLAFCCAARPAGAAEMKAELDCTANVRLLDTHFARFGYSPLKTMTRDAKGGVRFRLPGATKDVGQTGMYSYVVLAGDFEISANYEWLDVEPPKGGYGVSCGLAIETGEGGIMVSLARGHLPKQGQGYVVTRGEPLGGNTKFETTRYFTRATRGRLVLRRLQGELTCLAANEGKDLEELCTVPFIDGTVRQVRVFADQGGSQTPLDARLSRITVHAEEITGGFPRREQPRPFPWWPIPSALLLIAAGLFLLRRRLKRAPS
jgi:hypothetical protein